MQATVVHPIRTAPSIRLGATADLLIRTVLRSVQFGGHRSYRINQAAGAAHGPECAATWQVKGRSLQERPNRLVNGRFEKRLQRITRLQAAGVPTGQEVSSRERP